MSDSATVDCCGISLLKIPECSLTTPEQERIFHVSAHELSLKLQELFKTSRGAVYRTLKDLGITLSRCNKEGILFLREHCVINSYKASKLTLKDAEELFKAVQIRENMDESEKRAARCERKMQRMGAKKKCVVSETNAGQIFPLEHRNKLSVLTDGTSDDFPKDPFLYRCVLYRSPRQSRVESIVDYCELEGQDQLKNSDCISKLNPPLAEVQSPQGVEYCMGENIQQEVEAQEQSTSLHTLQDTTGCSHNNQDLPCMEKSITNGYQSPPLHRLADGTQLEQKEAMVPQLQEKPFIPPTNDIHGTEDDIAPHSKFLGSPLSGHSEESATSRTENCTSDKLSRITSVTDSTDEDEEGVSALDMMKRQKPQGGCVNSIGDRGPAKTAVHRRVVVTKLRHFAKTTSPKTRTSTFKNVIPHNASIGKRLPLSPSSTPSMEHSNSTYFPESLLVRIPRSKLNIGFHPGIVRTTDFYSSNPLTSLGKAPSEVAKLSGERVRRQFYKIGKHKPLSAFVSKKRAVTRTPSPVAEILPVEYMNNNTYPEGLPQDEQMLQEPSYSHIPRLAGKVIHAHATSLASKPHPLMRSGWSPLDNGGQEIKQGRIKKPRKGNANREMSIEQAGAIVQHELASEDDCMSITSSSASSMTITNSSPLPSKPDLPEITNQCSGRSQSSTDQPGSSSFCFSKFFDTLQPKLVIRNDELCPEHSLSLRGIERSKFNAVPASHPIWTWTLGQSSKPFKIRTHRHKSTKTKPHL